jgi:hypothetical protein
MRIMAGACGDQANMKNAIVAARWGIDKDGQNDQSQ